MWKKRPVNSYQELKALRPGSSFDLPGYTSLKTAELPVIKNLSEMKELIKSRLTDTNIVVFTDYDVDGVMSASIIIKMLAFLTRLAAKVYNKEPSAINLPFNTFQYFLAPS